jgi:hypothetical protein
MQTSILVRPEVEARATGQPTLIDASRAIENSDKVDSMKRHGINEP